MKKLFILVLLTLGPCFFSPAQIGVGFFPGPGGNTNSKPARSGFYGQSLAFGSGGPVLEGEPTPVGTPLKAYIFVYNRNGKLVDRAVSNPVGQFYSFVKPGNYTLVAVQPGQPHPPRNLSDYALPDNSHVSVAAPVGITVNTNQFTQVQIDFWIIHQ